MTVSRQCPSSNGKVWWLFSSCYISDPGTVGFRYLLLLLGSRRLWKNPGRWTVPCSKSLKWNHKRMLFRTLRLRSPPLHQRIRRPPKGMPKKYVWSCFPLLRYLTKLPQVGTDVTSPATRPVNQLFSFWNASTSLLGWGTGSPAPPTIVSTPEPSTESNGAAAEEPAKPENDSSTAASEAATSTTAVDTLLPSDVAVSRVYPLQTLIIVAIIAFLFGSLVRSLASPADFIYFNTDASDSDDALVRAVDQQSAGWREVRRLLEFKRGLFGWDVVIAVVRRPR